MGGILSSPTPPATPAPPPVTDPADEERAARLSNMKRKRRGRAGLINTGARGVFAPRDTGEDKSKPENQIQLGD